MHKGGVNITAETPDRLTPDGRDFARKPDSFAARCPLKEGTASCNSSYLSLKSFQAGPEGPKACWI